MNKFFSYYIQPFFGVFVAISMILIVISVIFYQGFVFFQTKSIIKEHNCVATDKVTQEFNSTNKGVSSITKVYYKCDDRNRWLRSYDLF